MHDRVLQLAPEVEVEQRRSHRIVYRDLKISYDGCTNMVAVRSPDLSPDGMFINTPRIFDEDAQLKLRFELVNTKVTVLARVRVRYCLPGVGVGVEFIGWRNPRAPRLRKSWKKLRSQK